MSKMKWLISLMLSFGLLAGCEGASVKPEKKVESKQEEVAKQEEQKDEAKPEEKQAEPEQKQQEEQKGKQEQKVEEKPKEEKPQEQSAAKQLKQQKAEEVKEEAKVNQPKETPKQEQKVDPNKDQQQVTVPASQESKLERKPEPQAKQVTISVKGHEGYLLGAKKIDVQEGDTVYKVLQRTGLDVDAMGSKGDMYVKGINDLYEKDITATSGWKYRVNGTFPNYSAGVVTVKPGDTIEWVYVLK
ncbi:hypothetical protein COD67_14835 [Bacillus cereus]|nr:hypothetical protein COI89_15340 [Bacillus cereus]PGU65919.1 hypothetical protein COD67_14835 [Bacillus cereus]